MVSVQARMPSMTASWLLRMPSSTWVWISWVGSFSVGMGRILLRRVVSLVHTIALTSVGKRLPGQTCRPLGSLHDGVHRPPGGGQPGPVGGDGRSPLRARTGSVGPTRHAPARLGAAETAVA